MVGSSLPGAYVLLECRHPSYCSPPSPPCTEGRTLISGARDNTIRLWNSSTCATVREIFDRKQGVNGKHRADVRRACLLPASNPQQQRQLLTASMDGTVRAWLLAADDAGSAGGSQPAASAAKPPATSDADLLLLGGDVPMDDRVCSAGGVTAAPRHRGGAAAVSLDSLDVGAGWDDTTKALLLEILAGKAAVDVTVSEAGNDLCLSSMSFFDREVGVSSLALNPNPARPIVAVSSSAHSLALLSLRMDTLPWLVRQAEGTLPSGILPQGTDLSPLTLVQTFAGHSSAVTGVALLPDEATIVSASTDSRVSVYDIATVDRRLSFAFGTSALCVALAPSEGAGKSQFVFVGGADCELLMLCEASSSCTAHPSALRPRLQRCHSRLFDESGRLRRHQCGLRCAARPAARRPPRLRGRQIRRPCGPRGDHSHPPQWARHGVRRA